MKGVHVDEHGNWDVARFLQSQPLLSISTLILTSVLVTALLSQEWRSSSEKRMCNVIE